MVITAGIAVLSLMESRQMPAVQVSDKLVHGLMYAVLAISWMAPMVDRKFQMSNFKFQILNAVGVCVSVTAYGALMEVLQRYCTLTRSGEMADLYADFLGTVIGVIIFFVITLLRNYVITKNLKS